MHMVIGIEISELDAVRGPVNGWCLQHVSSFPSVPYPDQNANHAPVLLNRVGKISTDVAIQLNGK